MYYLLRALLTALAVLAMITPVFALDLGTNITIYDGNSSADTGWYSPLEDDEVEPGMAASQVWDLEGVFLQDNILSLVGGFDFKNGVDGYLDYTSGDIFISDDEELRYGDIHRSANGFYNQSQDNPTYGYEYVIDLDFDVMAYVVVEINDNTELQTAFYLQNEGSSPWKYVGGGTETAYSGSFSYSSISDTGFSGDSHYLLTGFDLSFLGHDTDFYSHFTMGCGNDNLMGQGTVVPEPSTFLLFGVGGGLIFLARRRKLQK